MPFQCNFDGCMYDAQNVRKGQIEVLPEEEGVPEGEASTTVVVRETPIPLEAQVVEPRQRNSWRSRKRDWHELDDKPESQISQCTDNTYSLRLAAALRV